MIELLKPVFLQEPDGQFLNIKDVNDYSIGAYPSFSFDSFKQGVRIIILKNVLTGSLTCYSSATVTNWSHPHTVLPELEITNLNNKKTVICVPILVPGLYEVKLAVLPTIDVVGSDFTNCNMLYGANASNQDTPPLRTVYSALKDYPTKLNPSANPDWAVATLDDYLENIPGNTVTSYIRVESAEQVTPYETRANLIPSCAEKKIYALDSSKYSQYPDSTHYSTNFNYFSVYVLRDEDMNEIETVYVPISSAYEYTFSGDKLYYLEYINIPTVSISKLYRKGEFVYSDVNNAIYEVLIDSYVMSHAQLSVDSSFKIVTDYSSISIRYRKVYTIPLICSYESCITAGIEKIVCEKCSNCKQCKCKEQLVSVNSTFLISAINIDDQDEKLGIAYKDMYNEVISILKIYCCGKP